PPRPGTLKPRYPRPPPRVTPGSTRACSRRPCSTSGSGSPPSPWSSRSPVPPRSRPNAASSSARSTTTCCPGCVAPPPVLVALVGSTGAGKSTLVNSIVGAQVSATGVRRPTTNSPVLACHPDEIDWFAENNFLPTLPRVRQEGLARPGRDGLLVLAASEGMPRGIALLD